MRFEWDLTKNSSNLEKHGISFQDATLVFTDPEAIYLPDPDHSDGEFREIVLGEIENQLIVMVIFVERIGKKEEIIRIISARKATKSEIRQYYSREII